MRKYIVAAAVFAALPILAIAQTDDTPPGGQSGGYCPRLSQTMQRGARDATTVPQGQVSELQRFIADYYDVAEDEIVTGYFGRITQGYVIRFQKEQGLPAYGVVGSLTRAKIASVCGQPGHSAGDAGNSYSQGSYYSQATYYSQGSYTNTSNLTPSVSVSFTGEAARFDGSYITATWTSSNMPSGAKVALWVYNSSGGNVGRLIRGLDVNGTYSFIASTVQQQQDANRPPVLAVNTYYKIYLIAYTPGGAAIAMSGDPDVPGTDNPFGTEGITWHIDASTPYFMILTNPVQPGGPGHDGDAQTQLSNLASALVSAQSLLNSMVAAAGGAPLPADIPCQAEMKALMDKYPPPPVGQAGGDASAQAEAMRNSPEAKALNECLKKNPPNLNGVPMPGGGASSDKMMPLPAANAQSGNGGPKSYTNEKGCPVITRTLTKGSRGDDVKALQAYLITQDLLDEGMDTGYFGVKTQAAVMAWQEAHGIDPLGIVGPKTRAALANCTQ